MSSSSQKSKQLKHDANFVFLLVPVDQLRDVRTHGLSLISPYRPNGFLHQVYASRQAALLAYWPTKPSDKADTPVLAAVPIKREGLKFEMVASLNDRTNMQSGDVILLDEVSPDAFDFAQLSLRLGQYPNIWADPHKRVTPFQGETA